MAGDTLPGARTSHDMSWLSICCPRSRWAAQAWRCPLRESPPGPGCGRGGLARGDYYGEEAGAYVGSYYGAYFSENYFFGLGKAVGQAVGQRLGLFEVGQVVDGYLDGDGRVVGSQQQRIDPAPTTQQPGPV